MKIRIKNPVLTRREKIGLAVAGAATLGLVGAAIAVASAADSQPPLRTITIGDGCASFTINDLQKLRDELRIAGRQAVKGGAIDPLQTTAMYIRRIAPRCATYPANTNNPGEVKLFAAIYQQLLDVLRQENLLSDNDYTTWYAMLTTWAAGQGVAASELL
jgi:hypothetical protein